MVRHVGVCGDGYATTSSNECSNCTNEEGYLYIIFMLSSVLVASLLFWFIWRGVKDEESLSKGAPDSPHSSKQQQQQQSSPDKESLKAKALSDMKYEDEREKIEDDVESEQAHRARIMSLKPIRYISKINVAEVTKKIDLQAVTTNSITTFKLILSFYQIMTQVVSK